MTHVRLLQLVLSLALLASACDTLHKLSASKIKDVLDNPRKYENREVTLYGRVTGGASLLFVKYFELQDDSGTIRVVTDRVLPKPGEKVRVTGTMESIEFGTERLIVIREKQGKVK